MRIVSSLLFLVLLLLGVAFAILNSGTVTLNYYFATCQLNLAFLLILAFGGGVMFAGLLLSFSLLRARTRIWRLNSQLKTLQKELADRHVECMNKRD